MNESVVIPRLAQRAEGPLKRFIACAKWRTSTSKRTLPLWCGPKLATARSLAVCAARDDRSP